MELGETAHYWDEHVYVFMLIAFYVDNGKQLPIWKELPPVTYWLLPLCAALPLVIRALLWHPLVRASRRQAL